MAKSKQRPKKHTENTQAHKDTLTLKYWLIGAAVIAAVLGLVFLISFLTALPTFLTGLVTSFANEKRGISPFFIYFSCIYFIIFKRKTN